MGAPNHRNQRRSPYWYTSYMALLIELVETNESSFEEGIEKPIRVDAMVEGYKSIVKNSVWDMCLMHYFLELEVWKENGELFVSQGKCVNKIFQRFHMDSCKPMEIPLATNQRKEEDTSGEEVDATVY